MTCKHCGTDIHETYDDAVPFVHDETGNSMCDVHSISDIFTHRHFMNRTEAEPNEEEFEAVNLSFFLFSQN